MRTPPSAMKSIAVSILVALLTLSACSIPSPPANDDSQPDARQAKPHVLFISIDDLRPTLSSYGHELAQTPNLDALAHRGILFTRAYAQQAICGPSRASILTGLRPDTLGVTHNYVKFRDQLADVVTLPQHFMNSGYVAAHVGKIFHHGDKDEELSWNWEPAYDRLPEDLSEPTRYANPENTRLQEQNRAEMFARYGEQAKFGLGSGPAFEGEAVPDNRYMDGYNTDLAIATLAALKEGTDRPIFFGFGLDKPHLPWNAPQKYWDLYERADIERSNQTTGPAGGGAMGLHASFELRTFSNVPNEGEFPNELAIDLLHAYLASVSYVDAQVGRIVSAFEEQGLLDNTVIVVWSDHGYHLGEMGIWGKASNYEIATRVPLIVSTPAMRETAGGLESEALVELVDLYPTVAELANLPVPDALEGKSLVALFSHPDKPWKSAAFSQFPTPALREWGAYPLRPGMRETYFGSLIAEVEARIKAQMGNQWDRELFEQHLMGYSMRTDRYRFTAWLDTRNPSRPPLYLELFDHREDPDETVNVAARDPTLTADLLSQLQAGWRAALPSH